MKQTRHDRQYAQETYDPPGVCEKPDIFESGHGVETDPYNRSWHLVLCDEISYGLTELIVEGNKGPSHGVGQKISIPQIPQYVDVRLKGAPECRRGDEAITPAISNYQKRSSFIRNRKSFRGYGKP